MKAVGKVCLIVLVVVVLVIVLGSRKEEGTTQKRHSKPVVFTTFYPTQYLAERIGGELIEVVCPVPEGEDPIFWMPDAGTIHRYQAADLIVLNGAGFAKWVEKVSLPQERVVDTSKSFTDEFITYEEASRHSHGKEGEHAHEGIDGHTWLDPDNARRQAAAIRNALMVRFPEHRSAFEAGFSTLAADLDSLDRQFKAFQAGGESPPLLASHPAYNYIAQRYGWNLRNLDLDPEAMPSDETINAIRETLKGHPAKVLLWEATPTPAIATRMKRELGLTSLTVSPCELAPDADEDYLTVMQANLRTLRPVFTGKQ
ncbi:MAG: metal ABC transporter solute-binding protein, Zn/Mn family [Planctomycetota bacterium]|jgi:zinc transport system substrate-binding protein